MVTTPRDPQSHFITFGYESPKDFLDRIQLMLETIYTLYGKSKRQKIFELIYIRVAAAVCIGITVCVGLTTSLPSSAVVLILALCVTVSAWGFVLRPRFIVRELMPIRQMLMTWQTLADDAKKRNDLIRTRVQTTHTDVSIDCALQRQANEALVHGEALKIFLEELQHVKKHFDQSPQKNLQGTMALKVRQLEDMQATLKLPDDFVDRALTH